MVDFSVKQTGMSDVSGTSIFKMNVQEGVVDKSGAMRTAATTGLIRDIGEAGIGAMKGFAMAEYEKGLLSEIEKYNAPKIAEEAAIEAAAQEKAASLFAKGRGFDPALEAPLKELEKGYTESVAKYEQAKTQGIISPEQFRINVLNETRKAVAANPGLYPELMEHAKKVMGLSGIEETIKSDQQKAKELKEKQDKYLKDIDDRLQKEHIYYDSSTPIYQKETLLKDAENATRAHTLFGRGKELLTAGREEAAIQWVNDNRNDLTLGAARELSTSITALAGDKSIHYPTIKPQIEKFIDDYVATYRANVPASIIGNSIVKDQIASIEKWAEGLKKGFNSLASGEDMKTYVENSLAITTAGQKADLATRINVPAAEMVLNWAKAFPNQVVKDQATLQSFLKASSDIASLNIETPAIQGMLPKSIADKNYSQLITAAIDSSRKDKDFIGLNKMLEGSNMISDKIQDPIGKHIFLYNNIEALAKGDLTGSDIGVYTKANKMIGSFLDDKNTGLPLMFSEMQKSGATVDVLPDGRMLFIGENADQFNNKYGVKINTALQAYANAQGISVKEAAGSFYPEYFKKHVGSEKMLQDPDITTKVKTSKPIRVTISTPEQAKQALDLGRITSKEYNAIIKDMKK